MKEQIAAEHMLSPAIYLQLQGWDEMPFPKTALMHPLP